MAMRLRLLTLGCVAVLAVAAGTLALGAQGSAPTAAERAAARQAALTPGAQMISGTLREGMVGQTPYEAIKPADWNGTLVLDLDFVSDSWGAGQRRWFLERGYAIGGPNRQQDASAYEMRDHVDNFLTIRRLFTEKFGTPKRTIAYGVSRAGFPALSAFDMHPDIFVATVVMSGGGHGVVGTLLSKLDAVWAIKTLVDPASPLTLVNLPRPGEGRYPPDEAFNAIVDKAKATPHGRARLVLAAAFDQAPTWSIRNSPQPGPTDYDAQMENVVASFAGQFPHRVRYLNEAMAGGNFSWNHGIDYREQLQRSGMLELVRHAYMKAGANLDADLALLAKAPRVSADPAAVAKAERNGGYTGKIKGPVLLIKTIGDSYDPPSAEMAYEDLLRKAGTHDLVRTVYVNRPGHATQTVLERITAFQTLMDRLDSGKWPSAQELPDVMNATAEKIRTTLTPDPGTSTFVYHRPATAIRQWDFTNWGTYRPQSASTTAANEPNAQPNPYSLVLNWAQLPSEITWGQVIAYDFDTAGNVYVFHRNDPGILKFSPDGRLLKSWGSGMFVQAHSLTVDRFGFIWASDSGVQPGKGAQVFKFDQEGKLLLTLGKAGVSAAGPDTFLAPTWVVVGANGDVFVADGHGAARAGQDHRILKFGRDGRFIKAWGGTGAGNGQLNDPHGLALDAQGRLFVADRSNRRVQIFDQEGAFIAAWPQFGHPENVFIRNDVLYVSDSNSQPDAPYRRGIRIGSVKDGTVQYFIPEESYKPGQMGTSGPVGSGWMRRGISTPRTSGRSSDSIGW